MVEKITIIDNSVLFANAMEMLIENTFHKKVIAKLTFDDDLSEKLQKNIPDIALIAFDKENKEHLGKITELMDQFPETSFIALCNKRENRHHSYVKELGFKGFINKLSFIKDFKATIDSYRLMPVN